MENFFKATVLWEECFSPTEMLSHRNETLKFIGLRTERSQKNIVKNSAIFHCLG